MAIKEALAGGADEVIAASANADDPILSALAGGGTHVHASALESESDTSEGE
jgi:acetylglutamate/LysW-gamma-L-alpha-aminoadipate kinase